MEREGFFELVEEEYDEEVRKEAESYYEGSKIPEGDEETVLKKFDARLPKIIPEEFRSEVYNLDILNRAYSVLKRKETQPQYICQGFYERELDRSQFEGIDRIILDHSAVLDAVYKRPRRRREALRSQRWTDLYDLIDHINAINDETDQEIEILMPENIYDRRKNREPIKTANSNSYEAIMALKEVVEHFKIPDTEKPEEFRELGEDYTIAEIAAKKGNSMVVTADEDFLKLEEEFDIEVMSADLAKLGFKALEEKTREKESFETVKAGLRQTS